jgi:hypothetical protein
MLVSIPNMHCCAKIQAFNAMNPLMSCLISPKKPKGRDLSVAEKSGKRLLSSARMTVEPTLAGVKRLRIVTRVLRNSNSGLSDRVMEIACALPNWHSDSRPPLPTFHLLDLATLHYSQ